MSAYPYLPEGRTFLFVSEEDPYMREAKEYARLNSLDDAVKTGAVVVVDRKVVGSGANGSTHHVMHGCERVRLGIPTGQGYELCEGCSPATHAEVRAIASAHADGHKLTGGDLYLWGHWWACKSCWDVIENAGMGQVYLLEESGMLFNKESPENILGKWFT